MDFTQKPVSQGYKYLLAMTDTFTGWIEGFSIQTEKAEEVAKTPLHEIIPRFGLPGFYKMTMRHHLFLKVTQVKVKVKSLSHVQLFATRGL